MKLENAVAQRDPNPLRKVAGKSPKRCWTAINRLLTRGEMKKIVLLNERQSDQGPSEVKEGADFGPNKSAGFERKRQRGWRVADFGRQEMTAGDRNSDSKLRASQSRQRDGAWRLAAQRVALCLTASKVVAVDPDKAAAAVSSSSIQHRCFPFPIRRSRRKKSVRCDGLIFLSQFLLQVPRKLIPYSLPPVSRFECLL